MIIPGTWLSIFLCVMGFDLRLSTGYLLKFIRLIAPNMPILKLTLLRKCAKIYVNIPEPGNNCMKNLKSSGILTSKFAFMDNFWTGILTWVRGA